MKIIRLTAENVKRLNAVEITPTGEMVVVGGRNAQGKTSVLDSIMMALAGADTIPEKPLRTGAKKGRVVVEIDADLVVTRTFTESGGTVTVANKDGAKYPSPQSILDKLAGKLTFDPLAFMRLDSRKQMEMVRGLVALDFVALDAKRQQLFDERTAVNREAKTARAQMDANPAFLDAPADEVSVAALSEKLNSVNEQNALNEKARSELADIQRQGLQQSENRDQIFAKIARSKEELTALTNSLAKTDEILDALREQRDARKAAVAALSDVDPRPLLNEIANAEATNRKVRGNRQRKQLETSAVAKERAGERITVEIERIDDQKRTALADAKFPVNGLGFDSTGVTFNGLPFEQASSAEQLRVSMSMAIAMNPQLRICLIRDGSLLDDSSLATVAVLAKESDTQVWLERVGEGEECSVIIEDGYVKRLMAEPLQNPNVEREMKV